MLSRPSIMKPGPKAESCSDGWGQVRYHAGHGVWEHLRQRVGIVANNGVLFSESALKGAWGIAHVHHHLEAPSPVVRGRQAAFCVACMSWCLNSHHCCA